MEKRHRLLFILFLFTLIWQNAFAYDYKCKVGEQIEIPLLQNHINAYYSDRGSVPTTSWSVDGIYLRRVSSSWQSVSVVGIKATVNTLSVVTSTFSYIDRNNRRASWDAVYYVYVEEDIVYVTSIDLSDYSITLRPGQTYTLDATPYPLNATNRNVRWEVASGGSGVVSISYWGSNCDVSAKGTGETYIYCYATDGGGAYSRCRVKVEAIPVTSATVPSPINVIADAAARQLSVSTYPSNATVESTKWYIQDGSDYISLTTSGSLTGKAPGTAHVYCKVNGSVNSNVATVNVSEPSFNISSTSPSNNATGVSAFVKPSVTYSLVLYKGDNFSGITLKNSAGASVEGTTSISGKTVTFTPSKPLAEQTNYTLTIPARAVKNKWGTHYTSAVTVNFKTGDYTKLTLSASLPSGFVTKGSSVKLTASQSSAKIYYTTNGNTPTTNSEVYSGAITIDHDMKLRAIAVAEGYRQSDELSANYILSNVEMVRRFPVDEMPMYLYGDVSPFVVFSNRMEVGSKISDVTIKKNGTMVEAEAIVTDSTLFVVPTEPLELGCTYTVSIPAEAARTWQGESCKATSWTFSTGDFAIAVSMSGPELMVAIKTDGSLWTWGQRLISANSTDGSYSYTMQTEPSSFIGSDVLAVSSGYMHHAIIKRDGSLWMWGRQLCGEFGNNSTTASAQPVKVMDGVKSVSCGLQTTAIVKTDGSLWMCGRNDFGQIDDSREVKKQFIKVAEGVLEAKLGYGFLKTVKTDGTTDTRTWDETIDAKRKPTATGSGIPTELVTVEYGWKNAVALGKDGSVWTWGDAADDAIASTTPTKVIEGRTTSELTGLTALNKTVYVGIGTKAVLAALPQPLTADYATLTWTSKNDGIATVSSRGVVTGVAKGTATVTAAIESDSGRSYSQTFTVVVSTDPLKGDVNGDGTVNQSDVAALIIYLSGQTSGITQAQADVNGDGIVDVGDITAVISIMARRK